MTVAEKTDTLNSLLRGELAAVETYEQALKRVGNEPGLLDLRHITEDHRDSVSLLRQYILRFGGEPDFGSGDWGTWAETIVDAAGLFGDGGVCRTLREGEEHGIKEYEDALQDPNLHPDCKAMIRFTLLPKQRDHIRTLDALMDSVHSGCS